MTCCRTGIAKYAIFASPCSARIVKLKAKSLLQDTEGRARLFLADHQTRSDEVASTPGMQYRGPRVLKADCLTSTTGGQSCRVARHLQLYGVGLAQANAFSSAMQSLHGHNDCMPELSQSYGKCDPASKDMAKVRNSLSRDQIRDGVNTLLVCLPFCCLRWDVSQVSQQWSGASGVCRQC